MGLALARRQQLDGRLVGVHHVVADDERLERLGQRRQTHAADADPLRHARAQEVHARSGVDLALAVQRQVIVVLGHHHLGQQARRRDALVDDLRGHGRGLDRLAALARAFAANVAHDEELRRHAVQLFADLLADALQGLAAAAALALGGGEIVVSIDARQARRQRLANGLRIRAWRRRWRLEFVLRRTVFPLGIGHDGVKQHRLRRTVQALA